MDGLRDIFVLPMDQALIAIDHRDPAAKPAPRLRELEADKPSTEDDQMFWNLVKLQRLNVCHWICFLQSWRRIDCRTGSRVDDNVLPTENTKASVSNFHLDGFGFNEPSDPHNQFGSAVLVIIQMHVHQAGDHFAFP